jgi:hypothetical protein
MVTWFSPEAELLQTAQWPCLRELEVASWDWRNMPRMPAGPVTTVLL